MKFRRAIHGALLVPVFAALAAAAEAPARAPGTPAAPVAAAPPAAPAAHAVPDPQAVASVMVSPAIKPAWPAAPAAPAARTLALVDDGADPAYLAALRRVLELSGARVLVVPAASLPVAGTAVASVPVASVAAPPAARPAAVAAGPIAWEGQLRYRYESRTLLDYRLPGAFGRAATQSLGDRGDVSLMRTRVGATLRLAPGVRGYFSLQDARIMGAEGSPGGTLANVDLYNAYVDVDSLQARALSLRLGRQVLQYGDGRVLSGSDWANAGRGYDGARVRWAPARAQVDGFVAWINEGRTTGSDRVLSGVDALWKGKPGELEAYHVRRMFGDAGWTSEGGVKGRLRDATTGLRARALRGVLDVRAEGAVQRGHRASDPVRAWFGTARVTADLQSAWKTKVMVEHLRASGDPNPGDGTFQRFDPVYWGGHGFQGVLDVAGEANLSDWCGGLTAQPARAVGVQAEYHVFRLMQARDAWLDDAGTIQRRDVTGAAGRSLGREADFSLKWDPRGKVSVLTGVSHFWRGDYVRATGGGADVTWGFAQLAVTF